MSNFLHFSYINLVFILTLIVIYRVSFYIKLLDYPNKRKIHSEPIPTIGGIIIFISMTFATLIYKFDYDLLIFLYF